MRPPRCHTRSEQIEQNILRFISGEMALRNVSITELSRRTGIERTGLGKMLKGDQTMSVKQFITICVHLDICEGIAREIG